MKFRMWLAVVCVVAAASGVGGLRVGRTEDNPFNDPGATPPTVDAPGATPPPAEKNGLLKDPWSEDRPAQNTSRGRVMKLERHDVQNGPWVQKFEFKTEPDSMNEIQAAAKELHDAKEEEARAKAEKKLSELLNKYFDEDMKRREEELKKVEARVKNLRALLQKRREKQEEILDLQMKVLLNEADGLGFFNNGTPPGQPRWPTYVGQNGWQTGPSPAGTTILAPPVVAPGDSPFGSSGGGISISTGVPSPPTPARAAPAVKAKAVPRAQRAARPAARAGAASSSSSSDSRWNEEAAVDEAAEGDAAPSADVEPVDEASIEARP